MTNDELIEATARALAGPMADEMVMAGNPIGEPTEYPRWMLFQLDARAVIAVIAPAVLDRAAEELEIVAVKRSDHMKIAAIRALKSEYEA